MLRNIVSALGLAPRRPAVPARVTGHGSARTTGGGPARMTGDGPAVCVAGHFPEVKVPEVMRGRVTFVGLPPVDLGTSGIDWRLDPHRNRSWALNLHALRWMGRLVVEYERSGERRYLDRAAAVAEDWARKNPGAGTASAPGPGPSIRSRCARRPWSASART
nr:hypothetical protein GCM10020093_054090 [Planobispora longispora]